MTLLPPAEVVALVEGDASRWIWEEPFGAAPSLHRARARAGGGDRWFDLVRGPAAAVEAEAERLRWLADQAARSQAPSPGADVPCAAPPWPGTPVVRVVVADGPTTWLASEAPAGEAGDAPVSLADPAGAIERFAGALRALHRLPAAGCPFDASTDALLAAARRRVEAGEVDTRRFRPAHERYTPVELLGHLETFAPLALARPRPEPPTVLTHGRPDLAHLVLEPRAPGATVTATLGPRTGPGAEATANATLLGHRTGPGADATAGPGLRTGPGHAPGGWRRLDRLGVGDPYRDLAVAARSLAERFDAGAVAAFFEAYGLPSPDPVRLEFFVLLDELS